MRVELFFRLFALGAAGRVNMPVVSEVALIFVLRVDEPVDKVVICLLMRKVDMVGIDSSSMLPFLLKILMLRGSAVPDLSFGTRLKTLGAKQPRVVPADLAANGVATGEMSVSATAGVGT